MRVSEGALVQSGQHAANLGRLNISTFVMSSQLNVSRALQPSLVATCMARRVGIIRAVDGQLQHVYGRHLADGAWDAGCDRLYKPDVGEVIEIAR